MVDLVHAKDEAIFERTSNCSTDGSFEAALTPGSDQKISPFSKVHAKLKDYMLERNDGMFRELGKPTHLTSTFSFDER
jgi:hypothetical protein